MMLFDANQSQDEAAALHALSATPNPRGKASLPLMRELQTWRSVRGHVAQCPLRPDASRAVLPAPGWGTRYEVVAALETTQQEFTQRVLPAGCDAHT